jgi:hypothetical protein
MAGKKPVKQVQNKRATHRSKMLMFWGDPNNPFIGRCEMAETVLKIAPETMYHHFSPEDLQQIENEAYEIRKKNSTRQRSEVLQSLLDEAKSGNVQAAKEFLDRTEGKVVENKRHSGEINATMRWLSD